MVYLLTAIVSEAATYGPQVLGARWETSSFEYAVYVVTIEESCVVDECHRKVQ